MWAVDFASYRNTPSNSEFSVLYEVCKNLVSTDFLEVFFFLGPVVQSIVSLTSSLRVISLTVLADLIHNILIFFAEKM